MDFTKTLCRVSFFQHITRRRWADIFGFRSIGNDGFDPVGIILTGQQAVYRDVMLGHLTSQSATKPGQRRPRAHLTGQAPE